MDPRDDAGLLAGEVVVATHDRGSPARPRGSDVMLAPWESRAHLTR